MSISAKISLINAFILLALVCIDFFNVYHFPLLIDYKWHKILHLTGFAMFMGNMIVGPVWLIYAVNSGNESIIRFSLKLLAITDVALTVPGIDLMVFNGLMLVGIYGGIREVPYVMYSVIFLFSMWFLMPPVIYFQEKLYKIALQDKGFTTKDFKKTLIKWGIWGSILGIPPTIAFLLMVLRYPEGGV